MQNPIVRASHLASLIVRISRRAANPSLLLLTMLAIMTPSAAPAQEKNLHSFTGGNDGANPWGGLALFNNDLYGTAAFGGADSCGIVFQIQISGKQWTGSLIHTFTGPPSDGCTPIGNVAVDSVGNVYGSTQNGGQDGGGNVFRVSSNGDGTWTAQTIYSFPANNADGNTPFSGVIVNSAGNVYGTTIYGGGKGKSNGCNEYGGCGTIFKLTPNGQSWTETVLYRFTGAADGAYPNGLTLASDGDLYGTTGNGGTSGYGTVFRLVPSGTSWKIQTLYEFTGNLDGAYPAGAVALDSAGNVYGTAYAGLNGAGVIFEILTPVTTPGEWKDETLYAFTGNADGDAPEGGVIFDTAGNLYGTTAGEDAFNNFLGSVFKLEHSGNNWIMIPIYDFSGLGDGDTPFAGVIFGPFGWLYGTSSGIQGGGFGAVYAVNNP